MAIGTLNLQPNRNACPLSQQASFDAAFGAVGWIATGFFPRPMVLWSSRHQEPANSNPSLRVCRSRTTLPPTGARRSLCFPILESGHGPLNQNKCPLHPVPSPVASSAFHWQPVRSTKKMPSRTCRSGTRGRWHPRGCTFFWRTGIKGSINSHNSSDIANS